MSRDTNLWAQGPYRSALVLIAVALFVSCLWPDGALPQLAAAAASVVVLAVAIRRGAARLISGVLCLAILGPLAVEQIGRSVGAKLERRAAESRASAIKLRFEKMREKVRGEAERAVARIRSEGTKRPDGVFGILQSALAEPYVGFVLYRGGPAVWGGTIPGFSPDYHSGPRERITKADLRTFYSVILPIGEGSVLAVHRLLAVHTDVWDRSMIDYDLFDFHSERGGSSITVEYLAPDETVRAAAPAPTGSVEETIRGDAGLLARIRVDPSGLARMPDRIVAYALAIPILLAAFIWRRSRRPTKLLFLLLGAVLLHRLALDFPNVPIIGGAFFAGVFPGEWPRSPLDLLAGLAALIVLTQSLPLTLPRTDGSKAWSVPLSLALMMSAVAMLVGYEVLLSRVLQKAASGVLTTPLMGGLLVREDALGGAAASYIVLLTLLALLGEAVYVASHLFSLSDQVFADMRRRRLAWIGMFLAVVLVANLALSELAVRPLAALAGAVLVALGALVSGHRWSYRRILATVLPAIVFFQVIAYRQSEGGRRQFLDRTASVRIAGERDRARLLLVRVEEQLDAGLRNGRARMFRPAFRLWSATELAAAGYSASIEILEEGGRLLDRFSLNLEPETATRSAEPEGESWRNSEGEYYLDGERIFDEEAQRRILRVTLRFTYENFEFLPSANPYLPLFRWSGSRTPEDRLFDGMLALAVLDSERRVVFNTSGIDTTPLAARVAEIGVPVGKRWLEFLSGGRAFSGLVFENGRDVCVLFYPRDGTARWAAVFAHLLFQSCVVGLVAVVASTDLRRRVLRRPGYSTKVYVGFLAASLAPLLAYSFLIRSYLDHRLEAEAERRGVTVARMAGKFIEDFVAYRISRGEAAANVFNDELAQWIRRVMQLDLHIYSGNTLLATSRRELFDSGLLPPFPDGEVFDKIVRGRAPMFVSRSPIGRLRLLVVNTPLDVAGLPQTLMLSVPMAIQEPESEFEREELGQTILLIAGFVFLVTLAMAGRLARRISKPVETLVEGTSHIARGEFDFQIQPEGHDEVRTLVESFNKMARDLRTYQEETIKTSRLKALAELAQRVAHEIKNPLTPIQLSVEHVRKVYKDGNPEFPKVFEQCLDNILREVEVLRKLSRDFGTFSRPSEQKIEDVDLRKMLSEMTQPYGMSLKGRVTFRIDWKAGETTYMLDRGKTQRALSNILLNAVQATSEGEIVWSVREAGQNLMVRLSDSGSGIHREVIPKLFQPYFSTKDRGTGLGLAIARKDIEDQEGAVEIESSTNQGTTITCRFPIRPRGAPLPAKSEGGSS